MTDMTDWFLFVIMLAAVATVMANRRIPGSTRLSIWIAQLLVVVALVRDWWFS